jgi:small-conductance mechanosensitive channel
MVSPCYWSTGHHYPIETRNSHTIINDAIIIMAVVAVLVHVVCSAFEDILEAGHFKSIAAGTGQLARALAITLLLIICVPKIWWFLLLAWVLFFIWVTYTLREELLKLCESLYNAVRHRQEPNELLV